MKIPSLQICRLVMRCTLCPGILLFAVQIAGAWIDYDYDRYDYDNFAKTAMATSRIDMAHIDYPLLNAAIFYETNRVRAVHGLKALQHSDHLEKVAMRHSGEMVFHNFLSHESPLKGRRYLSDRMSDAGLDTKKSSIGENISDVFGIECKEGMPVKPPGPNRNFFSYGPYGKPIKNRTYLGLAQMAVEDWMNSPSHRINIMEPDFKFLGVGSAHYRDPKRSNMDCFKLTQNFSSYILLY